jgi:hypothetical protein
MSETLTVAINTQINLSLLTPNIVAGTLQYSPLIQLALALASGTGAGKANQLYVGQVTLASSVSTTINVHAPGADPNGATTAYANVKALIIQSIGNAGVITEGDVLAFGGQGDSTAWTSPFGSNADLINVNGGATLILYDGGANGYVVGTSTNHVLKVTNNGSNSVTFNIIIVGATA